MYTYVNGFVFAEPVLMIRVCVSWLWGVHNALIDFKVHLLTLTFPFCVCLIHDLLKSEKLLNQVTSTWEKTLSNRCSCIY